MFKFRLTDQGRAYPYILCQSRAKFCVVIMSSFDESTLGRGDKFL